MTSCTGRVTNRGLVSVADAAGGSEIQGLEWFRNEGTLEVGAGAELGDEL